MAGSWTLLLGLSCLMLLSQGVDIENENGVLVLTDANFEAALEQHPFMLVMFYAPWCGHCKSLKPKYETAAVKLAARDPPIYLAKLDATAEKEVAGAHEVKGYPTLKWFDHKVESEYGGGREEADIIAWVSKRAGPASAQVQTVEEVKSAGPFTILWRGGNEKEGFKSFEVACRQVEGVLCFWHAEGEGITLFRTFDEPEVAYTGELLGLTDWLNKMSVASYSEFDTKHAQMIFSEGNAGLFLFRETKDAALDEVMKQVAPELKESVVVSYSQVTADLGKRLGEFVGITAEGTPAVWVVDPKKDGSGFKKYSMEGEITADNIKKFLVDWKAGTLSAITKSEEIPAEPLENFVRVLVGKNFGSVAYDTNLDVLVMFYAPWCGHCKKLKPDFETAAEVLKDIPSVVIAKVDMTTNEIDGIDIKGYPTLYFFPAGGSSKVEYTGPRDPEGIVAWIKKNAVNKFEIPEASTGEEKVEL